MNVYSDSSHTTLKYLKDAEVNILNLLIMTGNFNIRDSIWNSSFPHHSSFYYFPLTMFLLGIQILT